jgi:hypothetical protein
MDRYVARDGQGRGLPDDTPPWAVDADSVRCAAAAAAASSVSCVGRMMGAAPPTPPPPALRDHACFCLPAFLRQAARRWARVESRAAPRPGDPQALSDRALERGGAGGQRCVLGIAGHYHRPVVSGATLRSGPPPATGSPSFACWWGCGILLQQPVRGVYQAGWRHSSD